MSLSDRERSARRRAKQKAAQIAAGTYKGRPAAPASSPLQPWQARELGFFLVEVKRRIESGASVEAALPEREGGGNG